MERVVVSVPRELLDELDTWVQRLEEKRSHLISQALREWLERQRTPDSDELLAEGYRVMAEQIEALASEALPLQAAAAEGTWRWRD